MVRKALSIWKYENSLYANSEKCVFSGERYMNYWAWNGKYIGRQFGDYLYSEKGNPLGVFCGDELYDFSGKYLGEVKRENRIIVNQAHKFKRIASRCKPCGTCGSSHCDCIGYAMLAGYEDFSIV